MSWRFGYESALQGHHYDQGADAGVEADPNDAAVPFEGGHGDAAAHDWMVIDDESADRSTGRMLHALFLNAINAAERSSAAVDSSIAFAMTVSFRTPILIWNRGPEPECAHQSEVSS
jgi:hypothetical protein